MSFVACLQCSPTFLLFNVMSSQKLLCTMLLWRCAHKLSPRFRRPRCQNCFDLEWREPGMLWDDFIFTSEAIKCLNYLITVPKLPSSLTPGIMGRQQSCFRTKEAFAAAQKRNAIMDKEALAVMIRIERFWEYFLDCIFLVRTDYEQLLLCQAIVVQDSGYKTYD